MTIKKKRGRPKKVDPKAKSQEPGSAGINTDELAVDASLCDYEGGLKKELDRLNPPSVPEKAETDEIEVFMGLPDRDLLRIPELAAYFRVGESSIRTWIQNGKFVIEKHGGTLWVTRTSVLAFRLKNRITI